MLRYLSLILAAAHIICAESAPYHQATIVDGDTIIVESGRDRIRLLWIDTPETTDNKHGEAMPEAKLATAALEAVLTPGAAFRLWAPGEAFERDKYGRILALILLEDGTTIQEKLITQGLTAYWRKYGDAPEPWHKRFTEAQDRAKEANSGLWATNPAWIRAKMNDFGR